jgi:hypothetical protein
VVDRLLLGFDARVVQNGNQISVDAQGSPSAFDVLHLDRPDWTGPVQRLWEDRYALEAVIAAQQDRLGEDGRLMLIAIAVLVDSCSPSRVEWMERVTPTRPREVGEQWSFLGFDVADAYLESATTMLTGLPAGDLRLNELGLINDLDGARQLREAAMRAYPDQNPFCIYEIWEVR